MYLNYLLEILWSWKWFYLQLCEFHPILHDEQRLLDDIPDSVSALDAGRRKQSKFPGNSTQ